ncbi:GMC family oxidoreductase [Isoptericola chiayiensis]|uniref:Cholesterol oxidase n=1 Tax=Isoptericola chiayiensis TaxID=579446 RepID=A0ABP8XZC9_9MICO|nr:GMC family oxidoreductase [Isoptericola chiayiensis]NOW02194.1 cholesterol oxidase [Isoptericola chiayiensis]
MPVVEPSEDRSSPLPAPTDRDPGGSDEPTGLDVVVVGSGFGGSVAALRLTEKGYRVAVLEAGRRFGDDELPRTSWDLRRFLWAPALGCLGIQRIHRLRDVVVLAGAGVGGGSLVYANTLYRPTGAFWSDPAWASVTDWEAELAPYYDQAERMLGVTEYRGGTPADDVLRDVARKLGAGSTFHSARVGVHLGDPRTGPGAPGLPTSAVPDPYFGGAGPARHPCLHCGECMTGCRHGAKNTLVKNYLYLAEAAGARVHALTTVDAIVPRDDGGYEVRTHRSGRPWSGRRTFRATQVVLAAGTLGTQRLLHALRDDGTLPHLSPRLGHLTRTNSEALLGAVAPRRPDSPGPDYTRGVAITSSFHPDEHTHVEAVRYGRGSNAMGLLQTVLVDGGPGRRRRWLGELWRRRKELPTLLDLRGWSERTLIALVMQTEDNSLTTVTRRGLLGRRMTSVQGGGEPNPSWIPLGHRVVRAMADRMGGTAGGSLADPFDVPMTAHILGGCTIGGTPQTGVIDPYHRVHGYPDLHVVDGSAVTANLGVNPSLTITALAERAFALWPNRDDPDLRPRPGDPYVAVPATRPRRPAVPASAPGALRLPIVEIR